MCVTLMLLLSPSKQDVLTQHTLRVMREKLTDACKICDMEIRQNETNFLNNIFVN